MFHKPRRRRRTLRTATSTGLYFCIWIGITLPWAILGATIFAQRCAPRRVTTRCVYAVLGPIASSVTQKQSLTKIKPASTFHFFYVFHLKFIYFIFIYWIFKFITLSCSFFCYSYLSSYIFTTFPLLLFSVDCYFLTDQDIN